MAARTRWRRTLLVLVAALLALTVALTLPPSSAGAHTPHDVISDVAVSPDFEESGVVYTISRRYLLKSTDGGDSWNRLVRGLTTDRRFSSLSVSESDPDVVYLGTRGSGVYRSPDAGSTWVQKAETLGDSNISFAEVSPHSPDLVVAGSAGQEGRVWISRDGGDEWSPVDGLVRPRSVAFDPADPDVLAVGDADGRVHVSEDGGASWDEASVGDGIGDVRAIAVAPSFTDGGAMYVGTATGGIWTSVDGGESFERRDDGLGEDRIMDVYMTARDSDSPTIWASTVDEGVFTSRDGGQSWESLSEGLTTDVMADDIGAPDFGSFSGVQTGVAEPTMFLASFDGLFRSAGGTDRWEYLDTQVSTNVISITVSPAYADDSTMAVAKYINGAMLSEDGGETWQPINEGLAKQFEWQRNEEYVARLTGIAFYPTFADDRMMFAGQRGYYLESDDAGAKWLPYLPEGVPIEGEIPADYYIPAFSPDFADDRTLLLGTDGGRVYRYAGDPNAIELIGETGVEVTAMVLSPDFASDEVVLAGTKSGVKKSTDAGRSWSDAGAMEREVTSLTISDGFGRDATAFAGTPSGLFVTEDAGESWEPVRREAFGRRPVIEAVVASPNFTEDGTLLVSVGGVGLFRSTDGGTSFEPVGEELIENQVVFNNWYHPTTEPIVFSPTFARDQTVFGFAEESLYRSTDGGSTWETIELPVTLHDPDVPPESPFLASVRYERGDSAERARRGVDPEPHLGRGFETPIGALSSRRIAVAVGGALLVFAVLSVLAARRSTAGADEDEGERRSPIDAVRESPLVRTLVGRVGISVAVLVAGLLILAA